MTASIVETAELPLVRRAVVAAPLSTNPALAGAAANASGPATIVVLEVAPEVQTQSPTAIVCRADLRAERQQLRKQQRLWALLGLSVLAATLGATTVVLDVVH